MAIQQIKQQNLVRVMALKYVNRLKMFDNNFLLDIQHHEEYGSKAFINYKRNIPILLLTLFIILFSPLKLHAQGWEWAKSSAGSGTYTGNVGTSLIADASGNVYQAGYFWSASLALGSQTLTNAGQTDAFLAKYDSLGNVIWAKSAGGRGDDVIYSITTDNRGNLYVAGWFASPSINFDTITLYNHHSTGAFGVDDTIDIFLVKYNAAGDVIWAKGTTGSKTDEAICVTTDRWANVYIAGYFTSNLLNFGSTVLTNSSLTAQSNMYLAKFDSSGNTLWAKSATGFSKATSISVSQLGEVYVCGNFFSTLNLGTILLTGHDSLTSDIFLAKYDTGGTCIWAKKAGGTCNDEATSLTIDTKNNIYLAGNFRSTVMTFDTTMLWHTDSGAFCGPSSADNFLVKYNSAGNVLWARQIGGTEHDDMHPIICLDKRGDNIYMLGTYRDTTTFGIVAHISEGDEDLVLQKYNSTGNFVWASCVGGSGDDYAEGLANNALGDIFVTGYFKSPQLFFGYNAIAPNSPTEAFIAKFNERTLGTNTINKDSDISIYPNPASNSFTLYNNSDITEQSTFSVYDLSGKLISELRLSAKKTLVNSTYLSAGVYICKIKNKEEFSAVTKLVIVK